MNAFLIKTLVLSEVKLRLRRLSSIVTLMAVVALSWMMIPDPSSGFVVLAINGARVMYTSVTLAMGSASLACIVFGLAGFYLVRGRVSEDLRTGMGGVIGATPVTNTVFLFSRWLGGMAYLGVLMLGFMGTILLLHVLRGEGPIEPLVYLRYCGLLLLPCVTFAVSFAVLFDSVPWLMGKLGDVVYFIGWCMLLTMLASFDELHPAASPLLVLDFTGLATAMVAINGYFHTTSTSLGVSDFNAALKPLLMPASVMGPELMLLRVASTLVACLPMLPAFLFFHRYSADRVRASHSRKRRSPLEILNNWLRPLARLAQPLYGLAASLPGVAGQVMADVALALTAAPVTILALLACAIGGVLAPSAALGPLVAVAVAWWGVLVSSVSTRDYDAVLEDLSGAVAGGATRRYLRQFAASCLLGLMFVGVAGLRWAMFEPQRAVTLFIGVVSLAALASLFGRCSRTARLFLVLFLIERYMAINAPKVAMIDIVASNGVANVQTALVCLVTGTVALACGYLYNRHAETR